MKLKVRDWKPFCVGDLFDIHPTRAYDGMSKDDLDDGGITPFVVNSGFNNGVGGYSSLPPTEQGGIITFSDTTDGNTFFFQPKDFIGFAHVQGMYPKNRTWSEHELLFFATMLTYAAKGRYNYGRKMRRDNISSSFIKLPVDSSGNPDWQWMEDYIKSLRSAYVSTSNKAYSQAFPKVENWSAFRFGDLIERIYKATAHSKVDLITFDIPSENSIPFVSRTEKNNGVDCYVPLNNDVTIEDGNAIVVGDTTSTISYQPNKFTTGDHIVVIRAPWLNCFTGLFIVSLLNNEKYRYSYGRAYKMDSIKETLIKLPTDSQGAVDWEFIEKYIMSLPYGDRII